VSVVKGGEEQKYKENGKKERCQRQKSVIQASPWVVADCRWMLFVVGWALARRSQPSWPLVGERNTKGQNRGLCVDCVDCPIVDCVVLPIVGTAGSPCQNEVVFLFVGRRRRRRLDGTGVPRCGRDGFFLIGGGKVVMYGAGFEGLMNCSLLASAWRVKRR
jgi:hypothetical protein